MIVPMKKVSVITQSKDAANAVEKLRSLGILHVEYSQPPQGKDIVLVEEDIALVDKAVGILNEYATEIGKKKIECKTVKDWKQASLHIVDLWSRMDQTEEYGRSLKKKIGDWESWGDFDPAGIKKLADKGIYVRLYQVPAREMKKFPPGVIVKQLSTAKGLTSCAVISREKMEIPFNEIPAPKMGLKEMQAKLSGSEKTASSIKEAIIKQVCHAGSLIEAKKSLEKELEFNKALKGMGEEGAIAYITGYIPSYETENIRRSAETNKWGLYISDPAAEDDIPVFIRYPKWVSIISPLFKLMEILPGYREFDMSPLFLLFLGLFFGMIIGDAGYGTLFILLTLLAQARLGKKVKDKRVFFLFYFFSCSAVLWGALTGTVFGQQWYLKAGFKPLAPLLNDTNFLQAFCFFLGAFHLTLGQAWQAVRKLPSLTALADVGWISVLWSGFFLAKMLILNDPLPHFVKYAIIGGVSLVILFTNPQKNIFKMVGEGLGNVALSIMNNFTDVVSYIRLFAVGLAGVAISDAVNMLAEFFGSGNIFLRLAILFFGHTINIMLGPLSVMVHGVRLNVLEFSSHAGVTWSGAPYKPLESAEVKNGPSLISTI
jgi:V/A-type H+-transporting ATPase subunit I